MTGVLFLKVKPFYNPKSAKFWVNMNMNKLYLKSVTINK